MADHTLVVYPGGRIEYVYDDALANLAACGQASIRRASHVEPTADGRWTADLAPVGGPILGPYTLRAEALRAEKDWLIHALITGELNR